MSNYLVYARNWRCCYSLIARPLPRLPYTMSLSRCHLRCLSSTVLRMTTRSLCPSPHIIASALGSTLVGSGCATARLWADISIRRRTTRLHAGMKPVDVTTLVVGVRYVDACCTAVWSMNDAGATRPKYYFIVRTTRKRTLSVLMCTSARYATRCFDVCQCGRNLCARSVTTYTSSRNQVRGSLSRMQTWSRCHFHKCYRS